VTMRKMKARFDAVVSCARRGGTRPHPARPTISEPAAPPARGDPLPRGLASPAARSLTVRRTPAQAGVA
jgi:hypothetical protein